MKHLVPLDRFGLVRAAGHSLPEEVMPLQSRQEG